ncbi:GDP-mannose 4,6-dehydratase [soil metagenome]
MGRTALITGVTGQDGAYLCALLLAKGYRVHGMARRSSASNTGRLEALLGPLDAVEGLTLHPGDLTDGAGLIRLLARTRPDEIYTLGAQSHVHASFDAPELTAEVDALGCVRLLEAVRTVGLSGELRFYQASTSELFGAAATSPQSENTPFRPRSPYAAAKLHAYWAVVGHREAYGLHASNGILFNHESPLRAEAFVTRKITRAVAHAANGGSGVLRLGALDARRDWGDAREYVEGMWRMLQQPTSDDYVLATGRAASVRDFAAHAFAVAGLPIRWDGEGEAERGLCRRNGRVLVATDPALRRPAEVNHLIGDAAKARRVLGWSPRVSWEALCEEMVRADIAALVPEPVGKLRAA